MTKTPSWWVIKLFSGGLAFSYLVCLVHPPSIAEENRKERLLTEYKLPGLTYLPTNQPTYQIIQPVHTIPNYPVTIIHILQSLREAPSVGGINDPIQDQSNEDENTMEYREGIVSFTTQHKFLSH